LLPAIAAGLVLLVVMGSWSIGLRFDPDHQPFREIRNGLTMVEGLLVVCSMLLAPAFLAGSLSGEKERGSIGLLLTTRVNSLEIVLGRWAEGLLQVLMIELACLPVLLFFAWLAGLDFGSTLTLLALPGSVAFGGAGIALAASAISRRGRDALLLVYLIDVLFLLSPLGASIGWNGLGLASPFTPLDALCWDEILWPSLMTSAGWLLMGLAGISLASWRLRPLSLAEGGSAKSRRRAKRRTWVPPLDEDRPMLWKELYIERVGTLGKAGRWIGGLLVLAMGLGSLSLLGYAAWAHFVSHDAYALDWVVIQASVWIGNSAVPIGLLIVSAVGLRAAVTISSERERGTWDALLTSPLEGGEILRGKLWGSLFALKWLIGSALLAWTIAVSLGGMFWREYLEDLIGLALLAPFLAAIGVRTSLQSPTATKSMGLTMGLGLAGFLGALFVAWAICTVVFLVVVLVWLAQIYFGLATFNVPPRFPMSFRLGTEIVLSSELIVATILLISETRVRFDRVAGRMTGGKTALAIDEILHGRPMAPVRLEGRSQPIKPEWNEVASGVG
jgi:ABC-type transport system involved in multi-copper enzyme maturation permease subunit